LSPLLMRGGVLLSFALVAKRRLGMRVASPSAARTLDDVEVVQVEVPLRDGREVRIYEVRDHDDALDLAIGEDTDPFGAICWPSAVGLANALVDIGDLQGVDVLEIGAGTGLCSFVAKDLGAGEVTATDIAPFTLKLLRAGAEAYDVDVQRLDVRDVDAVLDVARRRRRRREKGPLLVVSSDLLYEPDLARALATALNALLREDKTVAALVADPGRAKGRRAFLDALDDAYGADLQFRTAAATRQVTTNGGSRLGAADTVGILRLRLNEVLAGSNNNAPSYK